MDHSIEALDAWWAAQSEATLADQIAAAKELEPEAIRPLIGALTMEAGVHVGDIVNLMEIVEALSRHVGDAWGAANAQAISQVLEGWSARGFDLVGEDYPPLS